MRKFMQYVVHTHTMYVNMSTKSQLYLNFEVKNWELVSFSPVKIPTCLLLYTGIV